jgi:chemotaxis signal transduction protein
MVIPVCDLRQVFGQGPERRLYVVARCNYAGRPEMVAIPISGDCQLVQGVAGENSETDGRATFVAGVLHCGGESLPLLDIDGVVAHCIQPAAVAATEARQ